MKPCKECALYKDTERCPYDFKAKNPKLKATPQKTREAYIKRGYADCFWTTKEVKEYFPNLKKKK